MKKSWLKFIISLKNADFSKLSPQTLKKITTTGGFILLAIFLFFVFEIYVPINPVSHETIIYTVEKGWGDDQIAKDLEKLGIIRSNYFFRFYVVVSLQHSNLQAGKYNISPRMSIYQIAKKMARGDTIREKVSVLEGWTLDRIAEYMESKDICTQNHFIYLTEKDYSERFSVLAGKAKDTGLEGYLFPDTYEISENETCENVILMMLGNLETKLTKELRDEIAKQKKSIFDIITMASLIEKEVRTIEEKKIVSGILWKRLAIGMPLQLDSTINYITGKSDASARIKDTKIDSPYNTYLYKGLPKGPISSPGLDSIMAAIYPTQTKYWYYLSNGKTYFSETFEQHVAAKNKYLR